MKKQVAVKENIADIIKDYDISINIKKKSISPKKINDYSFKEKHPSQLSMDDLNADSDTESPKHANEKSYLETLLSKPFSENTEDDIDILKLLFVAMIKSTVAGQLKE